MMRTKILAIAALAALLGFAPSGPAAFAKDAQIDYHGFAALTAEVAPYRAQHLVTLVRFQELAHTEGALILDARSADKYAQGHIEGAINVPFTDFTDQALAQAIGDRHRLILIYCNNNFANNAPPVVLKRFDLALNIQTYINLYGYGYRNVYELADVVDFNDPQLHWVASAPGAIPAPALN